LKVVASVKRKSLMLGAVIAGTVTAVIRSRQRGDGKGTEKQAARLERFVRALSAAVASTPADQLLPRLDRWLDRLRVILDVELTELRELAEGVGKERVLISSGSVEPGAVRFTIPAKAGNRSFALVVASRRRRPWPEDAGGWASPAANLFAHVLARRREAVKPRHTVLRNWSPVEAGTAGVWHWSFQDGNRVAEPVFGSFLDFADRKTPTLTNDPELKLSGADQAGRWSSNPDLTELGSNASEEAPTEDFPALETKFRTSFESSLVPMFLWRADGSIADANDAYLALIGSTRTELVQGMLRWDQFIQPEGPDPDPVDLFTPCEREYPLSDGRRTPVLVGGARLSETGEYGVAFAIDLTGQKRAEVELKDRLRFDRLVAELSAAAGATPVHRSESFIPEFLARMGEFLGVEQVCVARFITAQPSVEIIHRWHTDSAPPLPLSFLVEQLPMLAEHARRGEPLRLRTSANETGHAWSLLGIPLAAGSPLLGMLMFLGQAERRWPDHVVEQFQVIGQIFANWLGRKQAESEQRQGEALNEAVLTSLAGQVAILDRSGTILRVNDAWEKSAREHGATPIERASTGANYLAVCRHAAVEGIESAREVLERLEAVLAGERSGFSYEYHCPVPDKEGFWYEMWVARLARREGGAVVVHLDCTPRRRAQAEAERNRQELAHVVRVATMGELAASVAHEVNQPLTAMVTNAHTARRLLATSQPDLDEVREILQDISENGRRAGEVVRRVRTLLKKGDLEPVTIDLGDLLSELNRLVSSELVIRQAVMLLELPPEPARVLADRVHLQQVVVNLILNGLEAMSEISIGQRKLLIRVANRPDNKVELIVRDSGHGISPDRFEHIFEAFYSTKPQGLGMGLSIARSIIEAHGGTMWAANNPEGGASVGFTLPAVNSRE
jgi:PAS domain S-box-containing protein